ncbi:hypothetical protein ABH920_000853 [Catenulispora sp. EB89]|uniref:hypothetical protein n=1 Tax=Catenulispora sp. EB89 TaxID=3156257 RepID=UPI0035194D8D
MTWVPVELTRRTMLTATGVALLGACASPAGTKRSGASPAKPVPAGQPDPARDRALSAEADLLTQYDAALALPAVAADSALTAKLTAIREEHASHAAAIKQGYTPPAAPTPSAPPTTAPSTTPPTTPPTTPSGSATTASQTAPSDPKTAVAALAKAEQDAASARTSDILSADGDTAMLLASIAASESGHAALLLGGAA